MMFSFDNQQLLSPAFKMNESFEVDPQNPNVLHCNLINTLKYNMDYHVVIPKGTKLASGEIASEVTAIRFSTEYKPLYASVNEVIDALKGMHQLFTAEEILKEIRNASKKVHQLLKLTVDPNQSDFELIEEDADNYYPATQYVIYQSAIQLLIGVVSKMIASDGYLPGFTGSESITLGDFTISEGTSAQKKESVMALIQIHQKELKDELNYWHGLLMGRSNRGYSKPSSAVTRKATNSPESRAIE